MNFGASASSCIFSQSQGSSADTGQESGDEYYSRGKRHKQEKG